MFPTIKYSFLLNHFCSLAKHINNIHLHHRELFFQISLEQWELKKLKCYPEIFILSSLTGLQLSLPIIAFSSSVPLDSCNFFHNYTPQERKKWFLPCFPFNRGKRDQISKKAFLQSEIKLDTSWTTATGGKNCALVTVTQIVLLWWGMWKRNNRDVWAGIS